ncbi:DJ-1/PfpI family protein [Halorhodospira halochloris]|uniref:DJ-1/YajL/PfpI superfamily n=1 Tax=Halorhodospira halochloris TaxID=1052 RepID=A0A0X8X6Z6_HALHR|nr:DJ-1 family glyoxalase III [Halorhodospira halochloris]MBK1650812.1 DJ-1 family protein [Halorhodospira halochloris]MCG5530252.1 DJ-1/PfpI family protein [Halorhodospira halochloris]MCG5547166.1 DJ-1/PfpI family protein [Halorhodospira halochloris]BAU56689.1 DJ-1/YajL/PfpI superfamily [Halorhodospira halochloris]
MSTQALLLLAEGSEELEAVTVVDLLRRAGINITVAGLDSGLVKASRGVVLQPDVAFDAIAEQNFDIVILPGGLAGTEKLESDTRVIGLLKSQNEAGRWIAAICAAPRILVEADILNNRRATAFPTQLESKGVEPVDEPVMVDGNLITSRGPGTAIDFALQIIEKLAGEAKAAEVEESLKRPADHRKY